MKELDLKYFTLDELSGMHNLVRNEDFLYHGLFFGYREFSNFKDMSMFRYPCRIDAYISILCVEGSVDLLCDVKRYTLSNNQLFICIPKNLVQIRRYSSNCRLYIFAFTDSFLRQSNFEYKDHLRLFFKLKSRPLVELSQDEWGSIMTSVNSFRDDITLFNGKKHYNDVITGDINLITYKTCLFAKEYFETKENKMFNNGKSIRINEIYTRFSSLLESNFRLSRDLLYYAEKLFITPKYLTSVVHQASGKTAKEWINDYTITEIKYLLKFTDMTVGEIADYLKFPEPSYMSKYFKRTVKVTPLEYRNN